MFTIIERPDIVILDGLHLAQIESAGCAAPDRYADLSRCGGRRDIERWFTDRLVPLMEAGVDDSKLLLLRLPHDGRPDERRAFATRVWQGINLPNLRDHIVKDRAAADLVLHKRRSSHRQGERTITRDGTQIA